MGFFDRLSRLLRSNLNDLVSKAEDPAKILDQSMVDMQEDLVKLRQAVAMAIASQKRLENEFEQSEFQVKNWYERAELALRKGEEGLAKEALSRRKSFKDGAIALENQLKVQSKHIDKLKRSLVTLESKIAEVKTKKDMLKARAQAAKAQSQLENVVGSITSNTAMAAFERMEDKVESLEASSQASAELAGADLESQFAAIEGKDDLDEELNLLRAKLKNGIETTALPESEKLSSEENNEIELVDVSELENDLEELKRNIE